MPPTETRELSVVIPTYRRGLVLLESIQRVLALEPRPSEIVVVDQTPDHSPEIEQKLGALAAEDRIRWIRTRSPSIPRAMNAGLLEATSEIVLFLDDDITPDKELIAAHVQAHQELNRTVVAGQVLQPGEEPLRSASEPFQFSSAASQWISGIMAGNFSIRRELAVGVGGFDENFVRVAYRFETEFAARLEAAGARIWYEPKASIRHLRAPMGGTRSYGDHRRTLRPGHSVGAFYYLLRRKPAQRRPGWVLRRLVSSVRTRHHLSHPWWIPATLLAETAGLAWAGALALRGPRLLESRTGAHAERESVRP